MRRRRSTKPAKSNEWGVNVVRYPNQKRIWMGIHILGVGFKKVSAEKGMFEVSWEGFDDEFRVRGAEECL